GHAGGARIEGPGRWAVAGERRVEAEGRGEAPGVCAAREEDVLAARVRALGHDLRVRRDVGVLARTEDQLAVLRNREDVVAARARPRRHGAREAIGHEVREANAARARAAHPGAAAHATAAAAARAGRE